MKMKKNFNGFDFLQNNLVPLMFIIICVICYPLSGFSPSYLLNEIVTRMGRNILIFVTDWQIWGIPGVVLAMLLSIPLSALLGLMCGKLMNMAKGREMILGYMVNYFVTGLYQLVVLFLMGSIIPIIHASVRLPRGFGIRTTVNLSNMRQCLDNQWAILYKGVKIPILTFVIIGLLCLFIIWFRRTKLGQDMRAVGQDMDVARAAGINVDRTRIISIIISTVLAGFGQIIYLQNIGNFPTCTAHSQIGMFCIAALLVGGASVEKASIGNVFLGVILFHTMFIVAPKAGGAITGNAMIGEYFRVFVSYGVITLALIMYEIKKRRARSQGGQLLAQAQKEGGVQA